MNNTTILITGGTGYIGSHISVELLSNGYDVVLVDNFSNSTPEVAARISKITGKSPALCECNVCDRASFQKIFERYKVDALIHCAGYKAVAESVQSPLKYHTNNLDSTLSVLEAMSIYHIKNLVFSSSAAVYGSVSQLPITEDSPLKETTNPYATSKQFCERIIIDYANSNPDFSAVILRYFNPIGAHPSAYIGEESNQIPNNLMPYITQVASGKLDHLNVFGSDYHTRDGSGVRDYIHICDLARGHLSALEYAKNHSGVETFNLGCGMGFSVFELIQSFEKFCNVPVPFRVVERREGDCDTCYADVSKALTQLNWKPACSLKDMCLDAWRWEKSRSASL